MADQFILNQLGIEQWYPRKTQHPWYNKEQLVISILPAILQVKCLVLLPLPQACTVAIDPTIAKILTGMLSVLQLNDQELVVAKIFTANDEPLTKQNWQQVFSEVSYWQPKFILQLDKTMPCISTNAMVFHTYHPAHLATYQGDKAAAYQDLLKLKNCLH